MDLDGLNLLDVTEVYRDVEKKKILNKEVFLNLNKYLYNRIVEEKSLTNEEIKGVEDLIVEINRLFSEDKHKLQKKKLLNKISSIVNLTRHESCSKDISNYDINKLVSYCHNIESFKKKKLIYKELRDYFDLRVLEKRIVDTEDFDGILKLINEFKKIYAGNKYERILLSKVQNLVQVTKRIYLKIDRQEQIKILNGIEKRIDDRRELLDDSSFKNFKNLEKTKEIDEIKKKIINKEIVFEKDFSVQVLNSIRIFDEDLEISNKRIFAIDDKNSLDLDGAFSIEFHDGVYRFDVYITDVPSFLKNNKEVAREAYKRGTSFYLNDFTGKRTPLHMLPSILAEDKLSLLNNKLRTVVDFEYIFNRDGSLDTVNVSRKKIRVSYNLEPRYVDDLLKKKVSDTLGVYNELKMCLRLMNKIKDKSDFIHLNNCQVNNMSGYVAFPSILTNYYIGSLSDFVIYRENAKYCVNPLKDFYTHSVTPLRKYVSNINLSFYLNQLGVQSFNEKELDYVRDNIDEILEHLNTQERLSIFADNYGSFVKKHL